MMKIIPMDLFSSYHSYTLGTLGICGTIIPSDTEITVRLLLGDVTMMSCATCGLLVIADHKLQTLHRQ